MRELVKFAGAPRYEAYFNGGVAAQITKAGTLSPVQHDGKHITEVAKLRSLRPGQIANLGFSFVTTVVGMEHMARIERRLGRIEDKVDALTAMMEEEIAAPVRDIAYSIHRFTEKGHEGVPKHTVEMWVNDLRRARHRLIPRMENVLSYLKPTDSFRWASKVKDLKTGAAHLQEATRLIELIAGSEAMLHRMAWSTRSAFALDGVEGSTVLNLAYRIREGAVALMRSTDAACGYDNTGARQRERDLALGDAMTKFDELIARLADSQAMADVLKRLMDDSREFSITVSNGKVLCLYEVEWPDR
jgi:hypothetical protein